MLTAKVLTCFVPYFCIKNIFEYEGRSTKARKIVTISTSFDQ